MENCPNQSKKGGFLSLPLKFDGADNGIRTRDPRLGKPMLYQLSYVRTAGDIISMQSTFGKANLSKGTQDRPWICRIPVTQGLLLHCL